MQEVRCINKIRDKCNRIIGYEIVYTHGKTSIVSADDLKEALKEHKVDCVNLKLTRDGRLINKEDNCDYVILTKKMMWQIYDQKQVDICFKYVSNIQSLISKLSMVGVGCTKICKNIYYAKKGDSIVVYSDKRIRLPDNCGDFFSGMVTNSLDLRGVDTSHVNTMERMFMHCHLKHIDISTFNTSNVISMRNMFANFIADNLDLSNFDTSNVKYMDGTFQWCGVNSLNISNFNTSNVTTMRSMFDSFKSDKLDLSHFDTSNVIDMAQMFERSSIHTLNLHGFDTRKVVSMNKMFALGNFNKLNLYCFNTSNVIDMAQMFMMCNANNIDISSFIIGDKTDTNEMFKGCQANIQR